MSVQSGRYKAATAPALADGWTLERLTQPSRLHGANGMRTGPDGRIYVAQVAGSQISAIDPDTGEIEIISPMGGGIIAPDDLAFDDAGNLYVTEITEGRVSMLAPNGTTSVVYGESPVANPITVHQGRLISGECRPGGRILELDRNGSAPRVILADAPMPNAFEIGPDGKLYFPAMATNQIMRISLDGGEPEVVASDLGLPDSVKFDSKGFIVSTQVASGQVLRIDPRTGDRTVLAEIGAGLDNCTFVGDRLFVSGIPGHIHEIVAPGDARPLVEKGLQWPLGLAVNEDGALFVADGGFDYTLRAGGTLELAGMLFSPGFPGFTRGVAASGPGEYVVTTANGEVARFWPARSESEPIGTGFAQLMDVAVAPGGAVVIADYDAGRIIALESGETRELASGLDQPMGVAIGGDGTVYVAEAGAGRVVRLSGGRAETVLDGLGRPEGLTIAGDRLFVVDTLTKELVAFDTGGGARSTIASALPVGAPAGVVLPPAKPVGTLAGPMTPFTGIALGGDGTLYVAGNAEGSVLALRQL
ncbi:gluconolaconase [Sphingobium sufflavum]|uniref:SMP-30/gluconolactonase/LRE family protein n=1 Tax=Sphingobium sufflavum TaxID=1129547 RepID=UPI001F465AA0|nr:SMP-30/gluconolactonase/LRE family protein [Sphingobium sufflavum]MCE7795199.1 gluconolaconase [Sphingobium sufflavum]